jgi:eukaryotic-like serine/threonine-protein kinase
MAPASLERPAVLRLGEWVVYPRLCRATRHGAPVHVRSQVVDLLTVLALRPNEVVSKEDVTRTLWPGVHVSDSALSRCMAELRQLFEDDARSPWLVETVAKRGYRLIAPVRIDRAEDLDLVAADLPAITERTPIPSEEPALPASAAPWWRAPAVTWSAVVCVLAAAAVSFWAWTHDRSKVDPVVLTERETVVLGDVINTTGDTSFDGTVRLALASQLEQAPFLRIVSDARVRDTLALMKKPAREAIVGATALEVCQREGAAVVLTGSIARLGRQLAVGVEAVECRTGNSLVRIVDQVDGAEGVLDAVGRVAVTLRSKLGETQASLRSNDVPPARATTASLDALRALSAGDAERDAGRLGRALGFYRQATSIDPQFAVAWARQGATLVSLGQEADAATAFAAAYQLAERTSLPERYYISAHYQVTVEGDLVRAAATLEAWKRLFPGSAVASTNLSALWVGTFGRYDDALAELESVARLTPNGAQSAWQRFNCLLALGRTREAKQALDSPALGGEFADAVRSARLRLAYRDGDETAVRTFCAETESPKDAAGFSRLVECGSLAALQGRVAESRRLYGNAMAVADDEGVGFVKLRQALSEAVLGFSNEAVRSARAGLGRVQHKDASLRATTAFAIAGSRSDAARALAMAKTAPRFNARTDAAWITVAEAEVAGLGDPDLGLSKLGAVQPFERGLDFALMPLAIRAILLQRTGRSTDAIDACRAFERWRGVNLTSPMRPLVQLAYARALAATGDRAASRDAYQAMLDEWKRADIDIPLLRTVRTERAALGQ